MKFEESVRLANSLGCTVEECGDLNFANGVLIDLNDGGGSAIALKPGLSREEATETVMSLLGNLVCGCTYGFETKKEIINKRNKTARAWAINKIMPEHELLRAIRSGIYNTASLADRFGITKDLVKQAVEDMPLYAVLDA